jgi:hypothetical protein
MRPPRPALLRTRRDAVELREKTDPPGKAGFFLSAARAHLHWMCATFHPVFTTSVSQGSLYLVLVTFASESLSTPVDQTRPISEDSSGQEPAP